MTRWVMTSTELKGTDADGAYLAAVAFASVGAGLHHKICHEQGGTSELPHAQIQAVVLPSVLAFNAPSVPAIETTAGGGVRRVSDPTNDRLVRGRRGGAGTASPTRT